jgi:adenosylmethionine-8-amino-7-oxononanoate aminotransferase
LQKKDYIGDFADKMARAEGFLAGAQKYIEKGTKLCDIASSLYGLYVGHTYRNNYKIQVSEAAKLRMQMYHGQEQMMHVVNIAKVLSKIAPPGIQEYLEYNLSAFEACGKAFDMVNKYARKIEDLSAEVFPKLREVIGSNKISAKSGREIVNMKGTVNQQLDVLFKMAD